MQVEEELLQLKDLELDHHLLARRASTFYKEKILG
jgi:hypothetical protein